MRRSPSLFRAGAAASVIWLVATLGACNDKPTDGDLDERTENTSPELIPFESVVDEPAPEDTEPEDTEPEDTEPEDTEPEDTEPEDTEPEVVDIDPMPGDTATFDTRPPEDPLCAAVQAILDTDEEYQDQLADAIDVAADDPDELVDALQSLPLDDVRRAYDDLVLEVPQNMRARVRLIRDFTLEHDEALAGVKDLEELSELIAEIEADPDAARVTRASAAVSAYTEDECGLSLAEGG